MKLQKGYRVYVAGPYGRRNGNTEKECEDNVNWAIIWSRLLISRGLRPFIPHLYHYVHKGWIHSPDENDWLELCLTWIPHCHCLLRLPGESMGADNEVARAKSYAIPIYYSIEALLDDLE